MNYPESLILTPPIWFNAFGWNNNRLKAWGPFLFEQDGKKIVGMELYDYGSGITFSDGSRMRTFEYKSAEVEDEKVIYTNKGQSFIIRPISVEDAPEFGYNKRRPGLTKEQLINEALRAFQPRI